MNESKNHRSLTQYQMIREIQRTGKSTFVGGNTRRSWAAAKLVQSGSYSIVKVGYNLYRLVNKTN